MYNYLLCGKERKCCISQAIKDKSDICHRLIKWFHKCLLLWTTGHLSNAEFFSLWVTNPVGAQSITGKDGSLMKLSKLVQLRARIQSSNGTTLSKQSSRCNPAQPLLAVLSCSSEGEPCSGRYFTVRLCRHKRWEKWGRWGKPWMFRILITYFIHQQDGWKKTHPLMQMVVSLLLW